VLVRGLGFDAWERRPAAFNEKAVGVNRLRRPSLNGLVSPRADAGAHGDVEVLRQA
jgi:hypothetical protein